MTNQWYNKIIRYIRPFLCCWNEPFELIKKTDIEIGNCDSSSDSESEIELGPSPFDIPRVIMHEPLVIRDKRE